ncbi:MAG: penicillin-binding protein 2, partial [Pseudomonadota bacterium]
DQNKSAKSDHVRRSDIVDRNGVLLARSLRTASLYADPSLIQEHESVAKNLSQIFPDLNYGQTLQKLQREGRFVWLKRNLTPEEQQKVLYLGEPGLGFKDEDRRMYPQAELVSHLVGYSSVDGEGIAGVEASFDKVLASENNSLALTLDVRFQHALRRELQNAVSKFKAKGAAGIIMDVRKGEVLASVSLPDFDPHKISEASDAQKFNKATLGAYELGSVFKVFSVAAYLDSQKNPMRQAFDAREPLKRRGISSINDFYAQERILSLPEVFIHSSNIGTALMAEAMGTKTLKEYYERFGLIGKSSLEIPEVATTRFHSPWQEVDTLSASFGHAIAVTPLQLVSGVASIVNGGERVEPTLIFNQDVVAKKGERIISPKTAHRMRQLLRLNVTDGSGQSADVSGLMIGGKTGTAEKPGPGGYDRDRRLSSFVGVFPMDDPMYAVYVMIDEPKGIKETHGFATAGWTAAPTAGKVVGSIANLIGMTPEVEVSNFEGSLRQFVKTEEQIKEERRAQSH